MPPNVNRGRIGCWTCRIRHRKCDELLPVCKECSSRQIPCYGYDAKPPEWMNDQRKLSLELKNIKHIVKENFRRIRRLQNRPSSPDATRSLPQTSPLHPSAVGLGTQTAADLEPTVAQSENTDFREAQHLVHYLDYIFPLQFPYYVDDPDLGGRGWLFWLLTKSAPLRQAALTLSALHQHTVSQYRAASQESELIQYHTMALHELRQVLCRREVEGFALNREGWVEFAAGGLALISFQVFQGGTTNWEPHVSALGSLLNEPTPAEIQLQPRELLDTGSELVEGMKVAQKFLVGNLLWFDILACVSTGSAPKSPFRQWLSVPGVDMSRVMGCQSWMMIIIGDIAILDAESNPSDIEVLHSSMAALEQKIHSGLETMNSKLETASTQKSHSITRVFAAAALVQLLTMTRESDMPTTAVYDAISRVIYAIDQVPKSMSLRGLTWPISVAGCVAGPDQQPYFETIFETILNQRDSGFSNCGTVLRIMKHCWNHQNISSWTPRRAMIDMGICALLV